MHEDAVIKQRKGRRIPFQLQESVKREISRLLQEGHIVKFGEIKEDVFSQTTVITVKKPQRRNCAGCEGTQQECCKGQISDAKSGQLSEKVGRERTGKTYFTTLDLTYAYGQVKHSPDKTLQFPNTWRRSDGSV